MSLLYINNNSSVQMTVIMLIFFVILIISSNVQGKSSTYNHLVKQNENDNVNNNNNKLIYTTFTAKPFHFYDDEYEIYTLAKTNCVRLVRHYFKKIFKYFDCFTKYGKNILQGLREWLKQARIFLQKFRHAWFIRLVLGFGEIVLEQFIKQM